MSYLLDGHGSHDAPEHAGHEATDPTHQGDHNHDQHGSLLGTVGGWFGLGKGASLTLLLPILLATWGLVGLLVNFDLYAALPCTQGGTSKRPGCTKLSWE